LKDSPPDDQPEISHEIDTKQEEEVEIIPMDQTEPIKEDEIMPCNCFLNQSAGPFPLSLENPSQIDIKKVFHSLELDDPVQYRQQVLEHISFN
jgi:hypothetical protein